MYVNISRSKLLVNDRRYAKKKKVEEPAPRCNHCGGLIRESGEMTACIMCSREVGHYCPNCAYAHASEVSRKGKKSA
ncbi:conserved protein of unknown function [Nitrospina watsonii]|uniref:Uncharacterized protein n=1 Tax=Nitrospina watsonii TaxID=1323948 RepID=A0ABN8W0S1_9BACT|nr:conserved protein of unknown function [Nitrospina watsonii]